MDDINSHRNWNARFASGTWEAGGGRDQTREFARAQVPLQRLPRSFSGTLLDFGCGLGDGMPVYRDAFPEASLLGMDVSGSAIEQCRARYGHLGAFLRGDHLEAPAADVIVASNVLEHLPDDIEVARTLLRRCKVLLVTVPYREIPRIDEHVRSYDEDHFRSLGPYSWRVFACRGWSRFDWRHVWLHVHLKNLVRPLLGRPRVRRRLQIAYRFTP